MNLLEQITNDMKSAMKAKDNATLSTLRLLISSIKNKKIDVQHELSDAEIHDVIRYQVKQLKDAITMFEAGGRLDLSESNKKELEVLANYLPKEMSEEELSVIVKNTLTEANITQKSEMGKAMGLVMKVVAGRADGTRVKTIIESMLLVFVLVIVGCLSTSQNIFASSPPMFTLMNSKQFIPNLTTGLKIARILILWGGIISINSIIHGGFEYTTNGVCDPAKEKALKKVSHGFYGIMLVIISFCILTMFIQKWS